MAAIGRRDPCESYGPKYPWDWIKLLRPIIRFQNWHWADSSLNQLAGPPFRWQARSFLGYRLRLSGLLWITSLLWGAAWPLLFRMEPGFCRPRWRLHRGRHGGAGCAPRQQCNFQRDERACPWSHHTAGTNYQPEHLPPPAAVATLRGMWLSPCASCPKE